ncbi:MAG: sterol carrier family protein [Actinomycetes bacterium]
MAGIDGGKVAAAYLDQWALTRDWCDEIEDWSAASAIDGWTLRDLVAHFGLVADSIQAAAEVPSDEKPLRLGDYIATYAEGAAAIDERTRGAASAESFLFAVDATAAAAEQAIRSVDGNPVVMARRGPIRWVDFLRTRCIELTVHSDDLARSVDGEGPPMSRPCLQVSTRALADVLSWRAPGRSVEVRVPPFAAIQCIEGPRHTRGTPAAVVEMDPITFCRLAAGRASWQSAVAAGGVRASGLRTDLAPYLPLF